MASKNRSRQSAYRMAKPAQLSTNVIINHTYRFLANSASAFNLSPTLLMGAMGTMCTGTNTTATALFASVKLESIEMFAPSASIGGTSTVSVTWQSATFGSGTKECSDSSNSQSYPAHLFTRPPKNTLCSFWNQDSSTALCAIVAPAGTLIDVNVTGILWDNSSATPPTRTISVGIATQIYYLALDGPSSNILRPISLNTTF